MSRIPPPKEQNGCIQTMIITRMIFEILFVPLTMMLGAVLAVVFALFAFATHPLLGLGVVLFGGVFLVLIGRWEYNRVVKEMPPEDR